MAPLPFQLPSADDLRRTVEDVGAVLKTAIPIVAAVAPPAATAGRALWQAFETLLRNDDDPRTVNELLMSVAQHQSAIQAHNAALEVLFSRILTLQAKLVASQLPEHTPMGTPIPSGVK